MHRDNPDTNAKDVYANLRLDGWSVVRIGKTRENDSGIPDAVVSRPGKRKNHLVEVKRLGGKMKPSQVAFVRIWPGCVHVGSASFEINLLLRECEERT